MAEKTEKHAGGRPRKFTEVEVLQEKIDAYFADDNCEWTICGLALALGFCDRQSLYDCIARNDEYSCVIKKAMFRVENSYEQKMKSTSPVGSIFVLKNMGWRDKSEVEHGLSADLAGLLKEISTREV